MLTYIKEKNKTLHGGIFSMTFQGCSFPIRGNRLVPPFNFLWLIQGEERPRVGKSCRGCQQGCFRQPRDSLPPAENPLGTRQLSPSLKLARKWGSCSAIRLQAGPISPAFCLPWRPTRCLRGALQQETETHTRPPPLSLLPGLIARATQHAKQQQASGAAKVIMASTTNSVTTIQLLGQSGK